MEKKLDLNEIIAELSKQRDKTKSPLKKAVLQKVLECKDKNTIIQNVLSGCDAEPIPINQSEINSFFREHILEIDSVLLEEQTSVGDLLNDCLREMERETVWFVYELCLIKAIKKIVT